MPERSALERSYHRLLLAYPRYYRRHRAAEIVTTMLEAAKPGQTRPTRDEVIHLLGAGLRCRLASPPGWAGKLAARIVTLWVAVVLGGVGAYIAWEVQARDLAPLDDAATAQLADSLAGQRPSRAHIESSEPPELAYYYKRSAELQDAAAEGWSGPRPVPAAHARIYDQVAAPQALLTDAHRRLDAEGWQTGTLTRQRYCQCGVFWASRDGLLMRMASGEQTLIVHIFQTQPEGVTMAAIAGFLVGALLAWPLMVSLVHRIMRTSWRTRAPIVVFGLPVLYACLANTVDNLLSMVPSPETDSLLLAADLMYPLANQLINPLAAVVIGLGLAAIAAITALSSWQQWQRGAPSTAP